MAELHQRAAKRLVGENAGEIVDAAVAFGLADDGDDLIGGELAVLDAGFEPRRVLHGLQLDFGDFNGHFVLILIWSWRIYAERVHGLNSPRSIFSKPSPRSMIGALFCRALRTRSRSSLVACSSMRAESASAPSTITTP